MRLDVALASGFTVDVRLDFSDGIACRAAARCRACVPPSRAVPCRGALRAALKCRDACRAVLGHAVPCQT